MLAKTVLAFLALGAFASAQVEKKFYDQKLSHLNGESGTWKQHYLENRQYFKPGGPIFLVMGGPAYAPIVPRVLEEGAAVQFAKELGANLIAVESRYFGQSRPTTDLTTENMRRYNTFGESIQDKIEFVKWLKSQPEYTNSKIVAYGAGLVGTRLVQLMRRNPGLVDIAIMSSAPVDVKFEVPEYVGKAVEVMKRLNKECYESLHDGLLCLGKIHKGETCQGHNITDIHKVLNFCESVQSDFTPLDLGGAISEILKSIGGVILLNNPNPKFPYNVEKMCAALSDPSENHLNKLGKEINKIMALRKSPCIEEKFEKTVARLSSTAWDTPGTIKGERQTLFLRCTEGALIRSPEKLELSDQAKTLPKAHFLELCNRLFNISEAEVRANTEKGKELYGSRESIPTKMKCGVFVSGSDDLFGTQAVQNQNEVGNCNRVIVIEGGSFAMDRYPVAPEGMSYPPGLRPAQLKIKQLIIDWLKTGDCCSSGDVGLADAVPALPQFYEVV